MSKKRPSHIDRIRSDADLTYSISLPFQNQDAEILIIDRDNQVEIAVADIPVPSSYYAHRDLNLASANLNLIRENAVAQWIIDDATQVLDGYDWKESNSRSRSGNYYFDGVYFKCDRQNVDKAVMNAKKFLTILEESVLQHSQEFSSYSIHTPPSEVLDQK